MHLAGQPAPVGRTPAAAAGAQQPEAGASEPAQRARVPDIPVATTVPRTVAPEAVARRDAGESRRQQGPPAGDAGRWLAMQAADDHLLACVDAAGVLAAGTGMLRAYLGFGRVSAARCDAIARLRDWCVADGGALLGIPPHPRETLTLAPGGALPDPLGVRAIVERAGVAYPLDHRLDGAGLEALLPGTLPSAELLIVVVRGPRRIEALLLLDNWRDPHPFTADLLRAALALAAPMGLALDRLRLLEELRRSGRPEREMAPARVERIRLAGVIRRVAEGTWIGSASRRLDLVGPEGLAVRGDPEQVARIVTALLDNAACHTPTSHPVIVWWRAEAGMGVLRVLDHGPGLTDTARTQLFAGGGSAAPGELPGPRAGARAHLGGSRAHAEAMGGALELESTGADGSTFRLRLPLAREESTSR